MITLQQSVGTNNQTIWCLRLRGEGTNLVTLGDFSASTGWTAGDGWTIGSGVATFLYDGSTETETLSRSITTESVEYILEYEITAQSGLFNFFLDSTSGIVDSNIELDKTVGKHTLRIKCNGGSTIKFTYDNANTDDTLTIDNIKLRKADNVVYLSTKDITLDNTYDGQVLNYDNYLSDVSYPSSIIGGGGTGSVTSFGFSISRNVSNSNFDSFFNELYPATDAGFLVSRIVDFGICWEGATTDTEITWLLRARVIDYNYEQRRLNFTAFQESELTNKEVPYYTIQKEHDNGVSYYPYSIDENYGAVLPIVYGSFNIDTFDYDLKRICPVYLVDKRYFTFVQATHKLYTQNSPSYTDALYKYISGLDTYMVLIPDNGNSVNGNTKSYVSLLSSSRTAGEIIKGKLFIVPKSIGTTSDYNEIQNILDRDNSTNITIADTEELSVRTEGEASTSEVGILGQASSDVQLQVSWQSDDGGNRQISLKFYNEGIATPAYGSTTTATTTNTGGTYATTSHNFGTSTTSKNDANLPWTIEEICNIDFVALNSSGAGATAGSIIVRQMVVILSNIIVSSLLKKKISNVRSLESTELI